MTLVPDQKFSTFASGGNLVLGDIIVGLRSGVNTQFTFPGASAVSSVSGTAHQVIAAPTTGDVILSLPQDIDTPSSPTFNNLTLTGGTLYDVNGNEAFGWSATPSAVNYLTSINQGTGLPPSFNAAGSDTNVGILFQTKGTGQFSFASLNSTPFSFQTGTTYQHITNFAFANTSATDTVTFPDANFTVAGTALALGGTNAALTASNGGIVYSTASALAILSGTATPNLPLLSGSSSAPTWGSYALSLGGAVTTGGALTLSGAYAATFTFTNTTSVTFPTSGTLATTAGTVSSVSGTTNRITSTGGTTPVIDISASYVGQSSITTLGTIGTGTWQGSLIGLTYGGTNNNLTASAGGILWSDSTKLNILSGTTTASQLLLSGSSAVPSWSTSTYPATNAINTLLYASSANVMSALSTANSGVLITSAGGVPSISSTLPSGITLVAPVLGTPASGTLTNCTGLPIAGTTGYGTGVATALAANVNGSGALSLKTSPTFVTPTLGVATATSLAFSPTTSGIIGTTAADNAASGIAGEVISSLITTGTPVAFSNATAKNLTSLSLTAGDWDLWGNITFTGTTITEIACGFSTTTNTLPDGSLYSVLIPLATSTTCGIPAPYQRINVSGNTTLYLVGYVTGSGTLQGVGNAFARRAR